MNPRKAAKQKSYSPVSAWELMKADFDVDYTKRKKEENINILSYSVKSHFADNYLNHFHIFTHGSVLENEQAGAGFLIPEFKTEKGVYLGKGLSVLTAEFVAILMALEYIVNLPVVLFNIMFCIDSNEVLYSLNSV